ncbi:BspA family leucine-rich repeat surface protein, partial [Enterococcus hirae]|uniref:BspA family leucine-rich repeat surface protein n=2 Tax=Enterococcus hirae TaxID=1354 RepID=UPI00391CACAD
MSKKKLTAKRKKQLLTMFAVAGVMGNTGIAPTMALADTLTPTAETATEQIQANEAKEAIDQTIQNVTDPLVNPTDSTTTASDSLAPTDETTDEATDEATDETTENTQEQAKEQEQATAPTAESEGDATNPTAEAPKVAQKSNVAAVSKITGTWGTSSYTFDENTGVLTIGAGELSGYEESPWNSGTVNLEAIKKIVLSGKVVAPENSNYLFSTSTGGKDLTNVTEIEGLSQLDTSNVTTMSYMFYGMSSVTSLDLSNFDTSKVTSMYNMCTGTPLKKLTLGDTFKFVNGQGGLTSAWKREDGKGTFYSAADFMKNYGTGDLTAGTYVSATGWWGTSPYNFDKNTGTLTIEAGELSGYEESPWNSRTVDLEAIKKIVLSGKVVAPENSNYLFSTSTGGKDLTNVTEIEGLSQLDTSNVTTMSYMFYGMSSVTSLDLSNFDTSKVTSMYNMCTGTPLKKLTLGDTFKFVNGQGGLTSAWKREDGKGTFYSAKDFMKNYGTGDLTAGTYVSVKTDTWGTSLYMFDEDTGTLTIGAGELSSSAESPWNSDKVDVKAIKKIVLAGKVVAPENASLLFTGTSNKGDLTNVTEIEGLSQLDTSNVTDMSKMFKGMSSITSLDVSGFDTSNVTNMQHMFSGMSSVTSLDVSGFDTSNVTDMANMFRGMSSVTSLDVSGFDTSKVTDMSDMFLKAPLNKLTLGDHFKAVGDTGLSAPKALNDGDQLTGNWIREDGQSKGYSPADFMTNYGTGDLTAGTYVAELVKSELKPQEYHVGDV